MKSCSLVWEHVVQRFNGSTVQQFNSSRFNSWTVELLPTLRTWKDYPILSRRCRRLNTRRFAQMQRLLLCALCANLCVPLWLSASFSTELHGVNAEVHRGTRNSFPQMSQIEYTQIRADTCPWTFKLLNYWTVEPHYPETSSNDKSSSRPKTQNPKPKT